MKLILLFIFIFLPAEWKTFRHSRSKLKYLSTMQIHAPEILKFFEKTQSTFSGDRNCISTSPFSPKFCQQPLTIFKSLISPLKTYQSTNYLYQPTNYLYLLKEILFYVYYSLEYYSSGLFCCSKMWKSAVFFQNRSMASNLFPSLSNWQWRHWNNRNRRKCETLPTETVEKFYNFFNSEKIVDKT